MRMGMAVLVLLLAAAAGWFALTQRPQWFQSDADASASARISRAEAYCLASLNREADVGVDGRAAPADGGASAGITLKSGEKIDRGSLTPGENDKIRACMRDYREPGE